MLAGASDSTRPMPHLHVPGWAASCTGVCGRRARAAELGAPQPSKVGVAQCHAAARADSAGLPRPPGSSSTATASAGSTRWRLPRPTSAPRRTRARARGAASWSSAPLPCRRARTGPALRPRPRHAQPRAPAAGRQPLTGAVMAGLAWCAVGRPGDGRSGVVAGLARGVLAPLCAAGLGKPGEHGRHLHPAGGLRPDDPGVQPRRAGGRVAPVVRRGPGAAGRHGRVPPAVRARVRAVGAAWRAARGAPPQRACCSHAAEAGYSARRTCARCGTFERTAQT